MTAEAPADVEAPAAPGPRFAENPLFTTPTTVADCRADYEANAELRRKFDATAKRQHGG